MCLAVPGQVKEIFEGDGVRMGRVNFGGIEKDVCLAYLPDIVVGDYTIVHVGFAITKVDEEAAHKTLEMFRELGLLDEEFNLHVEDQPHEVPD
jgi:hydrogenase expression/formation protein HypC